MKFMRKAPRKEKGGRGRPGFYGIWQAWKMFIDPAKSSDIASHPFPQKTRKWMGHPDSVCYRINDLFPRP
jgi:hypothetical protein